MARANEPDPDPARARLATLGVGRDAPPGGDEADGADGAPGQERVGWPTAPPGTPAARLRLSGVTSPDPRGAPTTSGWPVTRSGWAHGDDSDADGGAARRRGADSWADPWADELDHGDEVAADPWHPGGDGADPWARRAAEHWAERWLPASWRGARWDPGRLGAVALAAVAAVAAVVAAVGVWSGRPVAEAVPPLPSVAQAGASAVPTGARPAAGGPIVVSVAGKVARPGLVRLPEGSRVGEAVAAAGGAAPGVDLSGLNLAQRLADGEQVAVGVPAPAAAVGGTGAPAGGAASGGSASGGFAAGRSHGAAAPESGDKVDLNTATLEQLDGLPGVGPVTAQKILDWRTQNGRFSSVDQLQEVGGIGPARLTTLRARVTV